MGNLQRAGVQPKRLNCGAPDRMNLGTGARSFRSISNAQVRALIALVPAKYAPAIRVWVRGDCNRIRLYVPKTITNDG